MKFDPKTKPVPPEMENLPRDLRGYSIFYTVHVGEDGRPDFRVTDLDKVISCVRGRRCGVCGGTMGVFCYFIGGDKSYTSHLFTDPPMHKACAEYALTTCPHIVMPKAQYTTTKQSIEKIEEQAGTEVLVNEIADDQRPDRFGLFRTDQFSLVQVGEHLVIRAGRWSEVSWWKDGEIIQAAR